MQKTSKYLLRSLLYIVILHIAEFRTNLIFPKLHAQLEPRFRIVMTWKQKEIISPSLIHMQTNPTALSQCIPPSCPSVTWEKSNVSPMPHFHQRWCSLLQQPAQHFLPNPQEIPLNRHVQAVHIPDKATPSCVGLVSLMPDHPLHQQISMQPLHVTWRKPNLWRNELKVLMIDSWLNQRISHAQVPNVLDWVPYWMLALWRPIKILQKSTWSHQDF